MDKRAHSLKITSIDYFDSKKSLSNILTLLEKKYIFSKHYLLKSIEFRQNYVDVRNTCSDTEIIQTYVKGSFFPFSNITFLQTSSQNFYFLSHSNVHKSTKLSNPKFKEGILLLKSKLTLESNLKLLNKDNFNPTVLRDTLNNHMDQYNVEEIETLVYKLDYFEKVHIGEKHTIGFPSYKENEHLDLNLPKLVEALEEYLK